MRRAVVVWTAAIGLAVTAPMTGPASAAAAWTVPQAISGSTTSGEEPQVASSPSGAAVAVWEEDGATTSRIVAAVRSPGGVWGAEQPLSASSTFGIYGQQVAMDGRGDAVAVWQDGGHIQVARHPANGTWTTARTLSTGDAATFPEVAMTRFGTTVVVWQKRIARHDRIQVVRRPDGGAWSKVRTLSGAFGDAGGPQVAVDAHGAATVVWERLWADGQNSAAVVSRGKHGVWTRPRVLSPRGRPGVGPHVTMNAGGDTVVAWTGRQSGSRAIQAVVRRAGGTWSGVSNVSRATRVVLLGDVAVDATGHATLAWHRWEGGLERVFVTSGRMNGHWGLAVPVSPLGEDATWAHVSVGAGTTTVTWETSVIEGVQRTPGNAWGPVIALSNGLDASSQQLAMDTGGHAVVVWKQFDGTHDRVMVSSLG
jgi:hypothetical protein